MQKINFEDRGELSVTQWSLNFQKENKYFCQPLRNTRTNEVEVLFFAHPESIRLFRKFPHVIIMDATYKTNRYDMTLVEMVGFTCTHKTFNIAYAFMAQETVMHYKFVMMCVHELCRNLGVMPKAIMTDCEKALLRAIKLVFKDTDVKQLLCWVHIKHNIQSHAEKVIKNTKRAENFVTQCWGIFCSSTEEIYEERLRKLRDSWKKGIVGYVEKYWFTPYKKFIVRAWTDYTLHFHTRTTNKYLCLFSC